MISWSSFLSSDSRVEREDWSVDNGLANSDENHDGSDGDDESIETTEDDVSWIFFESDESKETKYSPNDVYNYIISGVVNGGPNERFTLHAGTSEVTPRRELSKNDHCKSREASKSLDPMDDACEITYEAFLREKRAFSSESLEKSEDSSFPTVSHLSIGGVSDDDGFPIPRDTNISFMETSAPTMLSSISQRSLSEKKSRVSCDSTPGSRSTVQRSRGRSRSSLTKYTEVTRCIRWWGHGRLWTCLAVSLAWMGSIFSVFARQSVEFVTLGTPLEVASSYYAINRLGLIKVELCFNESYSDQTGCQMIVLDPEEVTDHLYEIARLFGSFSMLLGSFLTLFLTSAIFWETINLRPIGFGLLITYFCQSFTMLFFDAQVCKVNKCSVGLGCYLSIAAACCWVSACITTATMESFKIRATRKRRRQARRRIKMALREAQKKTFQERMDSLETRKTSSTSSDTSRNSEDVEDPETGLTDKEAEVFYEI